jgi:hypothetical protein
MYGTMVHAREAASNVLKDPEFESALPAVNNARHSLKANQNG